MDKFGYKIVEIIGTGTFGTVYKCMDDNNNVRCIKKIQLVDASDVVTNAHFEMIQQEIYLLQNLAHPRIIGLYEYFCSNTDNKCIYIVMEYASNGSLSKMINDQQTFLDENKIKQVLIDIVLGVEYLHMKNVVHKDLKPCNILLCNNGRLKIADFGVSKIKNIDNCYLDDVFQRNETKEMGGSPIYMAPETLIHKHFSFSSDIWALGCILYELCALQPAFGAVQSMDELIRCTLTKEYPPLNPDNVSKQMVALCAHMMEADVKRRATIKDVIRNPVVIVDYYHSYFRFDP
ncbi:uncharacterized protein LOC129578992 [Sitodiplosis mosellana]|uniref:uncharacterized protein LOC129578992 n=1 Tax=Sitodiplosis mosellana TaxID=263140 RepID=UPI002444131E|nr:uncharacterized protein LOC129578992 [Sitodiplosis mosellana]